MKTLVEARAYARTTLDLTAADLPDLLLDQWAKDSFKRIISSRKRWPRYETVTTLNTVIGQKSYTNPMQRIEHVFGADGRRLKPTFVEQVLRKGVLSNAAPTEYYNRGSVFVVSPPPVAVEALSLVGTSKPDFTWVTGLGVPDLPDHYEGVWLQWILSQCYLMQNDIPMANNHAVNFEAMLLEANAVEVDTPDGFMLNSRPGF